MTPRKIDYFRRGRHFLFGMVHLWPILQGNYSLSEIEERAVTDAMRLAEAGFDAVMIENFGDAPFYPESVPPHTIAGMTRIAYAISRKFEELGRDAPKLGINVLRNDAQASIAIAAAVGADFVRVNVHSGAMVTDQGLIQGKAHETVRYRDIIHPECVILADLQVKHSAPLAKRSMEEEAHELWKRAKADGLILTGTRTGASADLQQCRQLNQIFPECPLLVGSGVTPEQLQKLLPHSTGLIVGTWLKQDGQLHNPVDLDRAKELVSLVGKKAGVNN